MSRPASAPNLAPASAPNLAIRLIGDKIDPDSAFELCAKGRSLHAAMFDNYERDPENGHAERRRRNRQKD